MNTIVVSSVPATPWRNGGGLTRELLAWPSREDWQVRISVAQVDQVGPFSAYPGVHRWFAVLSGAGVRLRIEGVARELTPQAEPIDFDGAAAVECELISGATTDLNLMLRGVQGSMKRLRAPMHKRVPRGQLVAWLASGVLHWKVLEQDEDVEVSELGALWMEAGPCP